MLRALLSACRRANWRRHRSASHPALGPAPAWPAGRDLRAQVAEARDLDLAGPSHAPHRLEADCLDLIATVSILPRLPSLVEAWSAGEDAADRDTEE